MSLLEELQALQAKAQKELSEINLADALETWRVKYLGTKGAVKDALAKLKDIPREQKGKYGQAANQLKQDLQAAFDNCKANIGSGKKNRDRKGRRHPAGHGTPHRPYAYSHADDTGNLRYFRAHGFRSRLRAGGRGRAA